MLIEAKFTARLDHPKEFSQGTPLVGNRAKDQGGNTCGERSVFTRQLVG